jgi:hypothetical protein
MFYGGSDVVAMLITCSILNSSTGQKLYTHSQREEQELQILKALNL